MEQALSLRSFVQLLSDGIRNQFGGRSWWVIGEISNLKTYPDRGHLYFHLIEKHPDQQNVIAEAPCMGFQDAWAAMQEFQQQTGQVFSNGMEVLLELMVVFHPVKGFRLQMRALDTRFTLGKLQQQRDQSLFRLVQENPDAARFDKGQLITRNQELPLKPVLQRLAVLSSDQSAGLEDFIHTLQANAFGYVFHVEVFSVRVQGAENAKHLVDRLIEVYQRQHEFDLVVMVRGGGAQTDFLLFDAYPLIRAIARFPLPVLCGLGHLKDVSLSDLCAFASVKTPTKAAEWIVAHNHNFESDLVQLQHHLLWMSRQRLKLEDDALAGLHHRLRRNALGRIAQSQGSLFEARDRFKGASQALTLRWHARLGSLQAGVLTSGRALLRGRRQELQPYSNWISKASALLLSRRNQELKAIHQLVKALGPDATLQRGFALVSQNGTFILSVRDLRKGHAATLRFSDGTAEVTVNSLQPNHGQNSETPN
jgi:exodeoxyribonuclease VII large subunit